MSLTYCISCPQNITYGDRVVPVLGLPRQALFLDHRKGVASTLYGMSSFAFHRLRACANVQVRRIIIVSPVLQPPSPPCLVCECCICVET